MSAQTQIYIYIYVHLYILHIYQRKLFLVWNYAWSLNHLTLSQFLYTDLIVGITEKRPVCFHRLRHKWPRSATVARCDRQRATIFRRDSSGRPIEEETLWVQFALAERTSTLLFFCRRRRRAFPRVSDRTARRSVCWDPDPRAASEASATDCFDKMSFLL